MLLKSWDKLPDKMKTPEVRQYYDMLKKKTISLIAKRLFDIFASSLMLIVLSPFLLIISVLIIIDSRGGVFYRQERVTSYGKVFRIHKFRTMVSGADKLGSLVTVNGDSRITAIGRFLRKYRLDELPQVIDVFCGNMSYVGTRPEVQKFVNAYTPEMFATLLLPAGITSEASIRYKDESELLEASGNTDDTYINIILPEKMKMNLHSIRNFSLHGEIATMFRTVFAVLGKSYDAFPDGESNKKVRSDHNG